MVLLPLRSKNLYTFFDSSFFRNTFNPKAFFGLFDVNDFNASQSIEQIPYFLNGKISLHQD